MTFHGKRHARLLGDELDARGIKVDPHWEDNYPIPNVGFRKPIKARQIEEWAEQEYIDRTEGDMAGRPTCGTCDLRVTLDWGCRCGTYPEGVRLLAGIHGLPLTWYPSLEVPASLAEGKPLEDDDDFRRPGPKKGDWVIEERVARPTSADLPDLPEDATPAQVKAWRKAYEELKSSR
jgi:hypothetical protein